MARSSIGRPSKTAALSGALDDVSYETDRRFNVDVPQTCPNVPSEVLTPRATWPDPAAYDIQADRLAGMFAENFKQFEAEASTEVVQAGPRG